MKHRPYAGALGVVFALATAAAAARASEAPREIPAETRTAVLAAIGSYVEHDVALKKSFLILDPRTGTPLQLAFDHVHQGVKPKGEAYLACVDFKDGGGKVYDVDVVVNVEGEQPRVAEIYLHKIDGKPVVAPQQ